MRKMEQTQMDGKVPGRPEHPCYGAKWQIDKVRAVGSPSEESEHVKFMGTVVLAHLIRGVYCSACISHAPRLKTEIIAT